jgi:hypothetical protein
LARVLEASCELFWWFTVGGAGALCRTETARELWLQWEKKNLEASMLTGPAQRANLFMDRMASACAAHQSNLLIEVAPWPEKIPYPLLRYDDQFLPFSKMLIDIAAEFACGFIFDLAAFLCLGASGAIALERAIAYVPAPLVRVLHGPFTTGAYSRAASESAFGVDAVTLCTADQTVIETYAKGGAHGTLLDAGCVGHADHVLRPLDSGIYHSPDANGIGRIEFQTAIAGFPLLRWVASASGIGARGEDYRDVISATVEALARADSP